MPLSVREEEAVAERELEGVWVLDVVGVLVGVEVGEKIMEVRLSASIAKPSGRVKTSEDLLNFIIGRRSLKRLKPGTVLLKKKRRGSFVCVCGCVCV